MAANNAAFMASIDLNETTQPKQRVANIVLLVLAVFFVILRLVSRQAKQAPLGVDDWTLIVALGCFPLI